eukprot:526977-Pyramimonas_sp.AAC.1
MRAWGRVRKVGRVPTGRCPSCSWAKGGSAFRKRTKFGPGALGGPRWVGIRELGPSRLIPVSSWPCSGGVPPSGVRGLFVGLSSRLIFL